MVLHYLDCSHIIMAYTVGGYAVLAAEQVGAFDVELVDVLTLILYLAALCYINSRHTFQHIAYGAVLLLGETADIIRYRVALLTDSVSLDSHLFELYAARFKIHCQRKRHAVERDRLLGEAHHSHINTATLDRRHTYRETAVAFRRGELSDLAVCSLDND